MKKKTFALILALVLVFGAAVGGTIAYLTAKTTEVKNTFTVGNIDIDLEETTTDYKMVPGNDIDKDPTITVEAGSEACYLYVKVDKSANLVNFIDYDLDDAWTALDGVDGVFYQKVAASTTDQDFAVLDGNQVTVLKDVTKEMMDAIENDPASKPTLTFTAYAVQSATFESEVDAWNNTFGA